MTCNGKACENKKALHLVRQLAKLKRGDRISAARINTIIDAVNGLLAESDERRRKEIIQGVDAIDLTLCQAIDPSAPYISRDSLRVLLNRELDRVGLWPIFCCEVEDIYARNNMAYQITINLTHGLVWTRQATRSSTLVRECERHIIRVFLQEVGEFTGK